MSIGEPGLGAFQAAEQSIQCVVLLQLAQIPRVRTGNVDRDVTGRGIDALKTEQVVVGRLVDWGSGVLADVDSQNSALAHESSGRDIGQQLFHAVVVEPHAIDDRLPVRNAKQAWLGISRLRARRDGTDFDEAEAQRCQRVDVLAVLVQPSSQTDRVAKVEPHHLHGVRRYRLGHQTTGTGRLEEIDTRHPQPVRGFGIEGKEKAA